MNATAAGVTSSTPNRPGALTPTARAAWSVVARHACGILNIAENSLAAFVEGFARFRQGHTPGRAVQQFDTEPVLECLHVLADDGRRYLGLARCTGEAAICDDTGKNVHARQAIHT